MIKIPTTTSPPQDFNQWWLQSKEDPASMVLFSSLKVDDYNLQDTPSKDLSLKTTNPIKRVSWGDKVQVREYTLGYCRDCSPHSMDYSRERGGAYHAPPRRLRGLEERQHRLYGDIRSNLLDFDHTDNSLDELMKEMDDLLLDALTNSDVPILKTTTVSSNKDGTPKPKSLEVYDKFFASPRDVFHRKPKDQPGRRSCPAKR